MGEYWMPVNLDKREKVEPHALGDGMKRGEWLDHPASRTNRRVRALIARGEWSVEDEVRAVSDYGQSEPVAGPVTERPATFDECDEWPDRSIDPGDADHRERLDL